MEESLLNITTPAKGVLQIELNRPQQLNALNQALLRALAEEIAKAKQAKSVKVVLLTGSGRGFCAGADIKELKEIQGMQAYEFARFGQSVFSALEQLGKPSIAALHGFAFGGGLELAQAASLRVAGEETVMGQPEIKLGLLPGFGGTQRLARLIGKGRALDLCLTGRKLSADDAFAWGLVNRLSEETKVLATALELASELATQSQKAQASILNVINLGFDLTLAEALELEASQFGLVATTHDKQEGVNAFLEKRQAVFSGE